MQELIKITDNNGKKVVSARELYVKLGYNKTHWKRWYNKNIINNSFSIEYEDWEELAIRASSNKTRDFALSIDFAKKLSMLAKTEKGEEIREYFIEAENKLKTIQQGVSNFMQDPIISMRVKQLEIESRVKELEAKTTTRPDYYTIAGYGSLNSIPVGVKLAASLGRKASAICKQRGYETDTTPDPRFGVVKMYPRKVLEEVFNDQ